MGDRIRLWDKLLMERSDSNKIFSESRFTSFSSKPAVLCIVLFCFWTIAYIEKVNYAIHPKDLDHKCKDLKRLCHTTHNDNK